MQIERFLSVITEINEELSEPIIAATINKLIALIPQASQIQQFEELLEELEKQFHNSVFNTYPPSKLKIIKSINGAEFCGENALNEIKNIVQSTKFYNPADKANALKDFLARLNAFNAKLTAEITSLSNLEVSSYELSDDVFEVGVILSEHVTRNEISEIQKYLEEWHRLLRYLNEITTGNHDNPRVSSLGTSDSLEIYFENSVETASCIATAIESITNIYLKVQEGKQMLDEIKEKGFLSLDISKDYEAQKGKMIKDGLKSLVDEIAKKYKDKNESGRLNELKNGLKCSFEFIASSIDLGINVEVHAPKTSEEIEEIEEADSEEIIKEKEKKNKEVEEKIERLNIIAESGNKTKLLPANRQERILGLPEPDLSKLSNSKEDKTTKK